MRIPTRANHLNLQEGDIVVIVAFDGWPQHLFEVGQVFDDSVSGYSITGPLAGSTANQDMN